MSIAYFPQDGAVLTPEGYVLLDHAAALAAPLPAPHREPWEVALGPVTGVAWCR